MAPCICWKCLRHNMMDWQLSTALLILCTPQWYGIAADFALFSQTDSRKSMMQVSCFSTQVVSAVCLCCAVLCGTACAGGFQMAWVMQQDDSYTRWMRQRSVISCIHPYFPSIPPWGEGKPREGEEAEKWIGIPGGCCWMISCWSNSRFIQWKIDSITFVLVFKGGRKRINKWCWSDQKTSADIF